MLRTVLKHKYKWQLTYKFIEVVKSSSLSRRYAVRLVSKLHTSEFYPYEELMEYDIRERFNFMPQTALFHEHLAVNVCDYALMYFISKHTMFHIWL